MSSSSSPPPHQEGSVNLGKPSLRRRLEAYYSLIAPDTIANQDEWKTKFDLIYQKFGGSHAGEQKLAMKLSKKYGNSVRLLVANDNMAKKRIPETPILLLDGQAVHDEEYYELNPTQRNSRVLEMTSLRFDPVSALTVPEDQVLQANPWLQQQKASLLNHIGQCRSLLPSSDPQHETKKAAATAKPPKPDAPKQPRKLSAFGALAELHNQGPLSLLHKCMNQRLRVRVLIRYVNGVRGTLTGYLAAFDKHMNMILRDVDEVYCPRHTDTENLSNVEVELQRRTRALASTTTTWSVRQRHLKQLMVRGDNVILVYRSEEERSAWPRTNKSPSCSSTNQLSPPTEQRVGSPGCLTYALQQRERTKTYSRKKY